MEPKHFESLYPFDARTSEIEQVLRFVKEGNSCQLLGLPGSGKSNILGLLAYNRQVREHHLGTNQKYVHFVYFNFSELRDRGQFDCVKYLFLLLTDSLRERKMTVEYEAVNNIFKEALSFQDELVLFQGLKRSLDYLSLERKLTIVFLFDRFEEYLPFLMSSFFANLRILRNRAKYRFAVVFSLNRPLEETVGGEMLSDFYEFVAGNIVYLGVKDEKGMEFRISYLEKITGKKITEKTKKEILALTAWHGKITRLSFEGVLSREASGSLAEFLLSRKTIEQACFEIWRIFSPVEKKALFAQKEEVYLEKIGLTKKGVIAIPLFSKFLTRFKDVKTDEKIVFDNQTSEIKQGDTVLSDFLTSSEYRLLSFLLSHEGQIVDREEIINAVWMGAKSTAGVSDQALDQLIFRLRKKIETDPNNPSRLLTVKGRGFKLNP